MPATSSRARREFAKKFGHRTILCVPLIREGRALGTISVRRMEVRPFEQKHIALLKTFADQAAIAIENVRLFKAEQQRTRELSESLEQQTATSEVLKVISSSPGELKPVFEAMLENATRICGATFACLGLFEGKALRFAAISGASADSEFFHPKRLHQSDGCPYVVPLARAKRTVQTADLRAETGYRERDPFYVTTADVGGARTALRVPLLKDDKLLGQLWAFRQEVRPFTDKQIELLKNFAAQAVIAIENARLLNELRQRTDDLSESLEQQTATSEVLKVISSSPGELQPVFQAMLENAVRVCSAKFGVLFRYDSGLFHPTAMLDVPPAFAEFLMRQGAFPPQPSQLFGRLCESKSVIQVEDRAREPQNSPSARLAGARSAIAVPMLKADELVGAFFIYRTEVRLFTNKQIDLVKNFAAQAVIAIENTRLLNEQRESLERQIATSEVLKVISTSPGELEPVFQIMLENATRICEARIGILFRYEDGAYTAMATLGVTPAYAEYLNSGPIRPGPTTGLGRVISTRQTVHIVDTQAEGAYAEREPLRVATAELGGARSLLNVPMLKEGQLVGAIGIYRQEVRPFTDKQIELVTNFASQAVIAIENTRLLKELRQRTDDLSESLQQQTATADVLKVISSSPGDLRPVFQSVLENATRLCEAKFGTLYLHDGESFRFAADVGAPREYTEFQSRRGPFKTDRGTQLGQVLHTKRVTHTPDYTAEPFIGLSAKVAGARSSVSVPMLKDEEFIGAIQIFRLEVRPFTDKQIALLENFAAQAVIAIENARLLNELRQRTDDLSESLEQQTGTSEVLKVISSTPGELKPVFDAMLANATRICDATFGNLVLIQDDIPKVVAMHGAPRAFQELRREDPRVQHGSPVWDVVKNQSVIHIPDIAAIESYASTGIATHAGARTFLGVPMLKGTNLIGTISIYRQEVRPFAEKQIELVKNFAAQAVIAIENTRLLNELRESLQQQTATADVLRVISNSPGELTPVVNAMLENATRICEAAFGSMLLMEGDVFRRVAIHNAPPMFAEFHERMPVVKPQQIHDLKLLLETKRPVHIADAAAADTDSPIVKYAGARTLLIVPMLKEGAVIGAIGIYRQEIRPFTDKQIELVANFAAQAVIAIENARLLNELRESLQQQTATADVLKVISRSTFDLSAVLKTLVESAVRLCDGYDSVILLREGEWLVFGAHHGPMPMDFDKWPLTRKWTAGRAVIDAKPVHVHDLTAAPEEFPDGHAMAIRLGHRTILSVPLLREGEAIGSLTVRRAEVRPFTDKQIELVETFADQAVIAIENVRLFDEVQARTRELSESLEQQTATAEVLKVISSSPGQLTPVFDSVLANATQLCEATHGAMWIREGDGLRNVAFYGTLPEAFHELWHAGSVIRADAGVPVARSVRERRLVIVEDLKEDKSYRTGEPLARGAVDLAGMRTLIAVPMLKENDCVGAITIYRREVKSRSSWYRTSPLRPSSPSRTRGCSTSCANRFSNRPRPPKYSKSSQARPVNWLLCSTQFWAMRPEYVRQNLEL
jgi:GAF domain-containing protein